jgi:hypothetical protein
MKQIERKILGRFLLAGFLIPCLLFSIILIGNVELGGSLTWILLIAWPAMPLLMSAEAGGGAGGEILAFLQSALANTVLYAAVGAVVAVVYGRLVLRNPYQG